MKEGELVFRVRFTFGGDRLPYDGPTSAQAAIWDIIRVYLNDIVSDIAKFLCV